jgi:hypothetical protein
MPKDSELPDSWHSYQATVVSPRSTRGAGGPRFRCPSTRLPLSASPLSLPISPPTAALAPSPSRNFTESAKPRFAGSKPRYSLATVKLALSKVPRAPSAPWTPITWSCAPRKMRPGHQHGHQRGDRHGAGGHHPGQCRGLLALAGRG